MSQVADEGPTTLIEAIEYFSDPDTCFRFVCAIRWPDGEATCPRCGSPNVKFISTRRLFECKDCLSRKQFSVKVGTVLEDSPIPLNKWLTAIWLIANCKNGISSYEIARSIGITQKSSWFLLHRIRLAMQTGTFERVASDVEVDETYIGGKARNMHKDRRAQKIRGTGGADKVAVMGLRKRHGEVRTQIVSTTRRGTVRAHVRTHIEPDSNAYTDALSSYVGLGAEYVHQVIDDAEAYARGKVHTKGLENFRSLPKRGIKGNYIGIEPFHLFRFLDEQAWRLNHRKIIDQERFLQAAGRAIGKRLTYRELTGKA